MNFGQEANLDAEDLRSRREATRENSSRLATYATTYVTSGSGYMVIQDPIKFDVTFLRQPSFTSGVTLVKQPDIKHYRYPQVNAGVFQWLQEPNPSDSKNPYYTGAYLYFAVSVPPIMQPRTDGSNVADLQARLDKEYPNSAGWHAAKKLLGEAKEALYLASHPTDCIVNHNLQFQQVAIKSVPKDMMTELNGDPAIEPVKPVFAILRR